MNNDNQARELVQELRQYVTFVEFEGDLTLEEFDALIARADAYLATPAGSTERPSDALWRQALREYIATSGDSGAAWIEQRVAELNASRPPAKEAEAAGDAPVAWQCRYMCPDEGWSAWVHCHENDVLTYQRHPSYEVRPLYTRPAPPAVAVGVSEEDVEAAAEAIWNDCPTGHKLLAARGYPIDWASQPESIKRDYRKRGKAALASFAKRRAAKGGSHE